LGAGVFLLLVVIVVVGVSVVSWRPHTTHCVPICAVPHIGHGAIVVVVRVCVGCAAVAPHTFSLGPSSRSISSTREEKGFEDGRGWGGSLGDRGVAAFLELVGGGSGGGQVL
jgi:hypothetical protein